MTKETLLSLPRGTVLHHVRVTNSDGSPLRSRIKSKPRLWKRQPDYFEVPMQHGLRSCFYITPQNIDEWEVAS